MADDEDKMDDDQKMSTDTNNLNQTTTKQDQIDLRGISIILDGWSRTCDTVLNTLSDQIAKVVKNNGKP